MWARTSNIVQNACATFRDYSLSGSYRKLVVRPNNLRWEILYYDDYQLPLVQGDIDVLHNKPLTYCSDGQ